MSVRYCVGDPCRVRAVFRDEAGQPYNPDAVTLSVTDPLGVETVYTYGVDPEVVRPATGEYHMILTLALDTTTAGRRPYAYSWRGTTATPATDVRRGRRLRVCQHDYP